MAKLVPALTMAAMASCASMNIKEGIRDASSIANAMATSGKQAFEFGCRKIADKCHKEGDAECTKLKKCQENMVAFVELCVTAESYLALANTAIEFSETEKAEMYLDSARAILARLTTVVEGILEK